MTRGPWTGAGFRVVGATCPTCGLSTVVYNGNYFCESAGCDWAMDENDPEHRPLADRHILRLAGVDDWGAPLPPEPITPVEFQEPAR